MNRKNDEKEWKNSKCKKDWMNEGVGRERITEGMDKRKDDGKK